MQEFVEQIVVGLSCERPLPDILRLNEFQQPAALADIAHDIALSSGPEHVKT